MCTQWQNFIQAYSPSNCQLKEGGKILKDSTTNNYHYTHERWFVLVTEERKKPKPPLMGPFFFPSTNTTCSRSNVFKTSFFIQELSSKFTTSLNISLYLVIFWILSILFDTAKGKIRENQIILKLNPERTDWPWRRITSQKKLESIFLQWQARYI